MNKYRLIEEDAIFELDYDSNLVEESISKYISTYDDRTQSQVEDEFSYSRNNLLVTFLASGIALTPNSSSANIIDRRAPIVCSIDTNNELLNYNSLVKECYHGIFSSIDAENTVSYTEEKLYEEILSFKSLDQSWDGYGAVPLEIKASTKAILLIGLLDRNSISKIHSIYPNPHGTLSVEWTNSIDEMISVEIGNDKMSYYVAYNSKEPLFVSNVEVNSTEAKKLVAFIETL